MPFLDANRMVVTIDYDDNLFIVGASIRGVVNLFVHQPVTLCGASLLYRVYEGNNLSNVRRATIGGKLKDLAAREIYGIEYVLFGARTSRSGSTVRVEPGHYCYPFAIPVPTTVPPTQRFGAFNSRLEKVQSAVPGGPLIVVEHVIDVEIFVANSLVDKHVSDYAPSVVRCVTPDLLFSNQRGGEGHIVAGSSRTFMGDTRIARWFRGFSRATAEQAHCDLFVYNTIISLTDTPFLHFAIRGSINCPFHVSMIRRVRNAALKQPEEYVIGSVTMPPLDSPVEGVRGRILVSPQAQEHAVTFRTSLTEVDFFVTMTLEYVSGGYRPSIADAHRMIIPVEFVHGSFSSTGDAVLGMAVAADGAVMAYDHPPASATAQYVPVGPVTEPDTTAVAAWGDHFDPVILSRNSNSENGSANNRASARHDNAFTDVAPSWQRQRAATGATTAPTEPVSAAGVSSTMVFPREEAESESQQNDHDAAPRVVDAIPKEM